MMKYLNIIIKVQIYKNYNEKYGITEKDFARAEIDMVHPYKRGAILINTKNALLHIST